MNFFENFWGKIEKSERKSEKKKWENICASNNIAC